MSGRNLRLGRKAARDLAVGMRVGDEAAVAALQLVERHGSFGAEHPVGIARQVDVAGQDGVERAVDPSEDAGYVLQIGKLALVERTVRGRDREQPVQHVVEQGRLVREGAPELMRVGGVAIGRRLGEAEQPLDIAPLTLRNGDDPGERRDLGRRHHPVSLGHLGRQRDETGRQHDVPGRRSEDGTVPVDQVMAREGARESPDRSSDREPQTAPAHFAPNGHR